MSYRQKFYIGIAVTAGVCSAVGLVLYIRHRRQATFIKRQSEIKKTLNSDDARKYSEITFSPEDRSQDADRISVTSSNINADFQFPEGNTVLTAEQAIILTGYLNEINELRLNQVLTTIGNLGTLSENQNHFANAGCIERLEKLLSTAKDGTNLLKILLALNNLSLNASIIERFRNIVPKLIELCRNFESKSTNRRYALQVLANLSVFNDLHDEYTKNPTEFSTLIESSWLSYDEAIQSGKILVNLSTNKSNIDALFKLTGIELKKIINYCTPSKKSNNEDQAERLEELLLRYLTFYSNVIDSVVQELEKKQENAHLIKSWVTDPLPHGQGSLYFELFDQDKQLVSKTILRTRYLSDDVNHQIVRFRACLEKLTHIQFESSFFNTQNDFDQMDLVHSVSEVSTPKKNSSENSDDIEDKENILTDLSKEIQEVFEEEETILAGQTSPSDQSLASFRSALSVNDNNFCSSPEKLN